MFRNLAQNPPPAALISQYLPIAHAAVRDGLIGGEPGGARHGACLVGARRLSCRDDAGERGVPWLSSAATNDELKALGALWTAREIAQQPAMLRKTHADLSADRDALETLPAPAARPQRHAGDSDRRRDVRLHRRMPRALSRCQAGVPGRGDRHHRSRLGPLSLFRARDADAAGLVRALRQQSGERRGARSRQPVRQRDFPFGRDLQRRGRARRQGKHLQKWPHHPAAGGNPRPQLRDDVELQLHDVCGARRALRHRRHAGADRA